MVEGSILVEIFKWVGITAAGGIIKTEAAEYFKTLKKQFINKFLPYFKNEQEAELYYDNIADTKAKHPKKPNRDIEDTYEEITSKEYNVEFEQKLKEWVKENEGILNTLFVKKELVNNEFNVNLQQAGRDVINVNGNVTINNRDDK